MGELVNVKRSIAPTMSDKKAAKPDQLVHVGLVQFNHVKLLSICQHIFGRIFVSFPWFHWTCSANFKSFLYPSKQRNKSQDIGFHFWIYFVSTFDLLGLFKTLNRYSAWVFFKGSHWVGRSWACMGRSLEAPETFQIGP